MKAIKIFSIIVLFYLLLLPELSHSEGQNEYDFKWQVGEELTYSVKWTFIYLGELKLQVLSEDTVNSYPVYHCRIHMNSNPSLPFINLHDVFESYIDAAQIYSHRFISYEQENDYVLFTRYDFDYVQNAVKIIIEKQFPDRNVRVLDSLINIPGKVQDSLSMLFFARAMAKNKLQMEMPVFAYNKFERTHINFTGKEFETKTNDHKVLAYFLDGKLKFIGIAGVKDQFRGYFSTDPQRVPMKAFMKAFIGNVKIELKEWKNWAGDSILSDN
jgi:hypothetical protein